MKATDLTVGLHVAFSYYGRRRNWSDHLHRGLVVSPPAKGVVAIQHGFEGEEPRVQRIPTRNCYQPWEAYNAERIRRAQMREQARVLRVARDEAHDAVVAEVRARLKDAGVLRPYHVDELTFRTDWRGQTDVVLPVPVLMDLLNRVLTPAS